MKRPIADPAWPDDVVEIYRNDLREVWDPSIERHMYNSYQNQLDLYQTIARRYGGHTVLDIGAAQATLALLLAESGYTVTAVDIRPQFLEYAKTRYERGEIRFVAGNAFELSGLGTFDVVFANQIIEHLVHPVEFLVSLGALSNADGIIVVSTPNHDYFRSTLPSYTKLGDPRQYEHLQFSAGGGGHFFAYTEEELRSAAARAKLEVLDVIYFESPWISGHFLFRFLHPIASVSLLRRLDRLALRLAPRRLAHQLCLVMRRQS